MKDIIIALIPILGTGLFAFRDVKRHLKNTQTDINQNIDVIRQELVDIKKENTKHNWLVQIENQMRTLVETCRPFFIDNPEITKFVIMFTDSFIEHTVKTISNVELFDFDYILDQGRIDMELVDKRAYQYLGKGLAEKWNKEHLKKATQLGDKLTFILKDVVNHKKERVFFESFEFLKYMLTFLNKINRG